MREIGHPSELEPRLAAEYLDVVCNNALDAAYLALEAASTEDDTNWTQGILPYGRVHGRFIRMSFDRRHPWFRLTNKTLDYTASVNGVLIQVVMDDPRARKKIHRLAANGIERFQASLLGPSCDQNVTWRLYIDSDGNSEGQELTATIMGFDTNLNVVCQWVHDYVPLVSVRAINLPQEIKIQEQLPQRRNRDVEHGTLNETEHKYE